MVSYRYHIISDTDDLKISIDCLEQVLLFLTAYMKISNLYHIDVNTKLVSEKRIVHSLYLLFQVYNGFFYTKSFYTGFSQDEFFSNVERKALREYKKHLDRYQFYQPYYKKHANMLLNNIFQLDVYMKLKKESILPIRPWISRNSNIYSPGFR